MNRFIVSQLMLRKDIKKQPTRCALQYICFDDFLWQQTISHKSSTAHVFWSVLVFLDIKLLTMCVRPWRHDRKGGPTLLSFWDFYLFESEGREKQDYDFVAFFFFLFKFLKLLESLLSTLACFQIMINSIGVMLLFRWGTPLYMSFFLPICLSVHRAPYLRNCTSSDHNILYTYVKWWYLQVFFSFKNFDFFWAVRKIKGKKMVQNEK